MESIVEKMLDEFTGVPVKTVKTFMTKTPSVFIGKIKMHRSFSSLDKNMYQNIHIQNILLIKKLI